MNVDPDATTTDSQDATTVPFVFVPRDRNIRKKHTEIGSADTGTAKERLGDDHNRINAAMRGWIVKKWK
jgi:hypothetical protein